MPTVRDLLALKNSSVVFTCAPETTIAEACRMLRDRKVGCLVVVRGPELRGLLTERDVATRVVAEDRDPSATSVEAIMTREVPTLTLDAGCDEAERVLRSARIRHLPVIGPRGLLGVVSLGDVARLHAWRARVPPRAVPPS